MAVGNNPFRAQAVRAQPAAAAPPKLKRSVGADVKGIVYLYRTNSRAPFVPIPREGLEAGKTYEILAIYHPNVKPRVGQDNVAQFNYRWGAPFDFSFVAPVVNQDVRIRLQTVGVGAGRTVRTSSHATPWPKGTYTVGQLKQLLGVPQKQAVYIQSHSELPARAYRIKGQRDDYWYNAGHGWTGRPTYYGGPEWNKTKISLGAGDVAIRAITTNTGQADDQFISGRVIVGGRTYAPEIWSSIGGSGSARGS